MAHFSLSMVILIAAVALAWRATLRARLAAALNGPAGRLVGAGDWSPLGALTIFAGTVATAAGPHSGGFTGQRRPPADVQGRQHARVGGPPARHDRGVLFGIAVIAIWVLQMRQRGARSTCSSR